MAEVIIMPKLGFNMDEGQLVKWHKAVGETVSKGEVLFEINTDKTTMPVEATADGTVLKLLLEEGEFADVFTPIAVIGQPGEDPDAALATAAGAAVPASNTETAAAPTAEPQPAAAVSAQLFYQRPHPAGLVPVLLGVVPEELPQAGVLGGLRPGQVGRHGRLLLAEPPAEGP